MTASIGLLSVIVAFPGHTHLFYSGTSIDPDQLACSEAK